MNLRSSKSLIGLIVLLGSINTAVLFVGIPFVGKQLVTNYSQDTYADGYDEIAATLASGNGYRFYPDTARTLMREPGYPIFLAGIFLIFGTNLTAVKLANMFLALLSAWLVARIARNVSSSYILTLGSPLFFLLHPGVLIAESRGGVEILFTFLLTLFVLSLYKARESSQPFHYLISGGALGLTVLVKSTLMLFPIVLFAYFLVFERGERPWLINGRNVVLMICGMFIVLSPWIVRNYSLTGKFVPAASVLGISAHSGQYVCESRSGDDLRKDRKVLDRQGARERRTLAIQLGYPFKDVKDAYYQYFYFPDDELKFSAFLLKRVVSNYESSPGLFASCTCSNLFDFWFSGKTLRSTEMNLILQIPFLLLAALGIAVSWKFHQLNIIAPLVLLIVYTVAVYVPILAQARYSIPLIPFLSILACITLAEVQKTGTKLRSHFHLAGATDGKSGKSSGAVVRNQKESEGL